MKRLTLTVLLLTASCSRAPSYSASPDLAESKALALAPATGRIAELESAATRNPDKADLWVALGQGWIQRARASADPGFYLNASAAAKIALSVDPTSKGAKELQGLVLLNDHKFAEARTVALDTLSRDPDDVLALGTLSDAELELGAVEAAVDAAQKMVDLKPNLPSYSRASWLAWLHGDVHAATEYARLAIDAGGDRADKEPQAWVIVQAAMIFWSQGDLDGADAGFDEALARVPGYAPALVGKGRVALAHGDANAAVTALEQAWAKSPLCETAWLLGDAREKAGDAAGAEAIRAELVKRGKQMDRRTLGAWLAVKNRDASLAIALLEEEKKVRDDLALEDAYGWALYRAGRIGEARAASDRALRLGTPDAAFLYHAGAIRLSQGDAGGRDLVARALALNPRFDATGATEAATLLR